MTSSENLKYRNFKMAMAKSQKNERLIGYKESFFNVASRLAGCDAKQCCYACAGLSEKPLYINNTKHEYLFVAIHEGHVNCLEKILKCVIHKIDNTPSRQAFLEASEKNDIKKMYLQKIYMSLLKIRLNNDEKRKRMIRLLRKYGFVDENSELNEGYSHEFISEHIKL